MNAGTHIASLTETTGTDPDFDSLDGELSRYCRLSQNETETNLPPVPKRVPTPDTLKRRLETLYLTREDVERLGLPEGYPILYGIVRTKSGVIHLTDDFKRLVQTLDNTILEQRRTLAHCSVRNSQRAIALHILASSLYDRHRDMLWDDADLKESVEKAREAFVLCPEDDPHRALVLHNLSRCRLLQSVETEDTEDHDEAIQLGEHH